LERLQKIISRAGFCSRRAAERLLQEGRVTVNGLPAKLGQKADPKKDDIRLDGKPVKPIRAKAVYLFHKPKGVVTTLSDPQGRPCLADFLAGTEERLFSVGRLDFDASGLLILTNDGDLAQRLSHPSHETQKTYLVEVRGWLDKKAVRRLEKGILLGERPTEPAFVKPLKRSRDGSRFLLTIHEGRHHQVKRMCRRVGLVVDELKRIRVGPFELGDLAPGKMRTARKEELELLDGGAQRPRRKKEHRP
jgi:23S rRNA pseudouridine2605 synthase